MGRPHLAPERAPMFNDSRLSAPSPLSFVADWDEPVDISRPPKLALSTAKPKARETTTSRIYHNAKMPYHPQTMQTPFGIPNPLPNLVCRHNSHITAA